MAEGLAADDIIPSDPQDPDCAYWNVRIIGADGKPTAAAWAVLDAAKKDPALKDLHRQLARVIVQRPEDQRYVELPLGAVAPVLADLQRPGDPTRCTQEHPVVIYRSYMVDDGSSGDEKK